MSRPKLKLAGSALRFDHRAALVWQSMTVSFAGPLRWFSSAIFRTGK